jgi:hypothetical protein
MVNLLKGMADFERGNANWQVGCGILGVTRSPARAARRDYAAGGGVCTNGTS